MVTGMKQVKGFGISVFYAIDSIYAFNRRNYFSNPEHLKLTDDECNEDWERGEEFKRKVLLSA